MCIVVAAKGADSDGKWNVDVGSRLIRNAVGAAYKVKRRQVHRLLLGVEPGKESLPQSIASNFRFVSNRHPVSAESQARAAQECRPVLIDPQVLFACPNDFHGPPGRLRQQHRFGRVFHAGASAEVAALILVVNHDG